MNKKIFAKGGKGIPIEGEDTAFYSEQKNEQTNR